MIPGMAFDVIVEVPRGQRNKYELDHATGRIRLDRMLFTATHYPADYGSSRGRSERTEIPSTHRYSSTSRRFLVA